MINELIGLLCVHQCSGPRQWDAGEINLLQQLSVQVGYAVKQAQILEEQQLTAERERHLTKVVSRMRDSLDRTQIFRTVVRDVQAAMQAGLSIPSDLEGRRKKLRVYGRNVW